MSPAERKNSGREWLTEAEVTVLIAKELKPYHEENRERIDSLFAALNQLKGSITSAAWIIGTILVIAGLLIALYKR